MDWNAAGAGVGGAFATVLAYLAKHKIFGSSAKAEVAANDAEAAVITTLRHEVDRMSARLANLESRCDNQARRIWQLEAELARHGIEVPA